VLIKLGGKIKKLRKNKHFTQGELADKVGISSNHLSNLERGIFQPSIEVVKRLASELDLHVDSLLQRKTTPLLL
jgi:transcriptional regulator with XRE-family HTH domain